MLSSFLVKLCCIILAAKVFQYLKPFFAGHYCKPIEGCQTQTDRPPLQSLFQTKTSSAKVFHTKFSSTNKHRRGGRCYIACNQWLHCGVWCDPVRGVKLSVIHWITNPGQSAAHFCVTRTFSDFFAVLHLLVMLFWVTRNVLESAEIQIQKYKYTSTNIQVKIQKYT